MEFPYQFEEHPAKKGTCPKCGFKETYRYYEGLPREFGVCERRNTCTYHSMPSGSYINANPQIVLKEPKTIIYPEADNVLGLINNRMSNIHLFCEKKLKISEEHLRKWKVGTDKYDNTVFVLTSEKGKDLNIKTIPYLENGKRDRGSKDKPKKPLYLSSKSKGENFTYSKCLYGAHLLTNQTVCLVESEKTAVISSWTYPEYDWLATGGNNGAKIDAFETLVKKKVIFIPDSDKEGRENSTITKLKNYEIDFTILDLFPERTDGYDLADAIIEGIKPKIEFIELPLNTTDIDNHSEEPDSKDSFLSLLESFSFSSFNEIPEPEPIISTEGNTISTDGNITVFKGQSKSGKSGLLNGIMGGFLAIDEVDTIGLSVKPNSEGKFILHVDSEQSSFNHFKSIKSVLRRAGRNAEPKWFKSYLLREINIHDRKKAVELLLATYSQEFNGVHAIIIDGIADFCTSVNDEKEANEIVHFFEKLAIKYTCPVITIIHLNPSSETKGRGHLDSQLERKAESIINIKKDKASEISTIEGVYLRNSGSIPTIQFKYDTEKGYHVYCGFKTIESKMDKEYQKYSSIANNLYDNPDEKFSSGELVERIEQSEGVKTRSARNIIDKLINLKLIMKEFGHTGKYYLCSCAEIVQSA